MNDFLSIIISVLSYLAGAWVAFKIFDNVKKKKQNLKDELLLWPLFLVCALGAGGLLAYVLKSAIGVE